MRYAVAYVNLFDNELSVEILEGSSWRDALLRHSYFVSMLNSCPEWIDLIPKDLEDAKDYCFECDSLIDVVPVLE